MPVQVRASLWFLICAFMQKGISVISTPVFTRLLTTEEYGAYNVFNSWLGIITIFVSLNLSAGVFTQGLVKNEEDKNAFASSIQGLSTVLTFAWTIVYLLFHEFWNSIFELTTVQMLAMLVMIWATAVFNFWACSQRVEYKYKALVVVTTIVSIAKPAVGIVFVLLAEDKVTARILGLALVELVGYFALYIIDVYKGKVFFSKKYWLYALGYNLPLIPHYLSQIVLSSSDRIMIGKLVGKSAVGIYSIAYSISLIMKLFNTSLMQTMSPWIYKKIKAGKYKDIAPIAYVLLIGICIINLVLIVLAPEVVAIFAPSSYHEAIWVIPPVAMSVYLMFCYDLFAKFAFYYEKTRFIMVASVSGAVLNLILNYIFIPIYGYMAAGFTTLVCYLAYCIMHYLLMVKVCDEFCDGIRPYNIKILLSITLIFFALGFMFETLYVYPYIRYAIIGLMVIVAFVRRDKLVDYSKKIIQLRKENK